jgi:hypothetical protein
VFFHRTAEAEAISKSRRSCGVASLPLNSFQSGIWQALDQMWHRNDDADDRRNQRANRDVESSTSVIKPLLLACYLLLLLFNPRRVLFSEPFPNEVLL